MKSPYTLIPLGNTLTLVESGTFSDPTATTEAEVVDYYPYGAQRIKTGSFTEQCKYIGEQYDTQPELSYLNARYYDGTTGRFLSQDPVFW